MTRRRSRNGFTLVEVLVAATLMVIVMGMTYAAYSAASRSSSGWETRNGIERQGRALLALMARELRCSRASSVGAEAQRGPGPAARERVGRRSRRPSFIGHDGAAAEAFLDFVTAAGMTRSADTTGGLSRVAYRHTEADRTLWRRQTRLVDLEEDAESEERWMPLARNVARIACTYHDGKDWLEAWDVTSKKALPRAVQLDVALQTPEGTPLRFVTTAAVTCTDARPGQAEEKQIAGGRDGGSTPKD